MAITFILTIGIILGFISAHISNQPTARPEDRHEAAQQVIDRSIELITRQRLDKEQ